MQYPFEQKLKEGKLYRTFSPDVDSDELVWHQDLMDRVVTIINSGGWKFQREDELPINLMDEQILFIPKNLWHRVLKGKDTLIIEIQEF